jgi:NAD+ kinase
VARVLIVGHHERPDAASLAGEAARWLEARGHQPFLDIADARALGLESLADGVEPKSAEVLLSLGGDGTMLRAVHLLDGAAVPVIGVNVGLLGYLTEVEPVDMLQALERFFNGNYSVESRMMLRAEIGDSAYLALNEASLEKREAGHTVRMRVFIDGEMFTTYQADGLIASTPTGSTAYSLSARGPVVSPRHRAVLLTPVSPHMLFDRSLVLDPAERLEIEVIGHRLVDLAIDGQRVATLGEGDRLACGVAAAEALFVRFGPHHFHQVLKAKFGLADR